MSSDVKSEVVYLFMALRGCYGSVSSQESWDRLSDSLTLRHYLDPYIKRLPGRTTVLESLNAVSEETRSFIWREILKITGVLYQKISEIQRSAER